MHDRLEYISYSYLKVQMYDLFCNTVRLNGSKQNEFKWTYQNEEEHQTVTQLRINEIANHFRGCNFSLVTFKY